MSGSILLTRLKLRFFVLVACIVTQILSIQAADAQLRQKKIVPSDERARRASHLHEQYRHQASQMSSSTGQFLRIDRRQMSTTSLFFNDDFESGTGSWTVDPNVGGPPMPGVEQWHLTTANASSPMHSWWQGIDSLGNYRYDYPLRTALISPVIDLSSSTGQTTLLFAENMMTEAGWDFCMVDVSTNAGTSWTHLRGGYGNSPSGNSNGWRVTTLDLTPYNGVQINVRFFFETGDTLYNDFPGWFVDDVAVFDSSGTISGNVYYDLNQNGIHDGQEEGLGSRIVTATGPIFIAARTDFNGAFTMRLPLGSYQVSQTIPPPWTQTSSPSSWNINLTLPDQAVTGADFGNYRAGSLLRGTVFNDLDHDGTLDAGEPPRLDSYIELYDSTDGWIDQTLPDSNGRFSLPLFGSGVHHLRQYIYGTWVSTIPGGNPADYSVNVPPVDTVMDGFLFGSYDVGALPSTGIIRGFVFNDLDHNGVHDDREPMLADRIVKISSPDYSDEVTTDSAGGFEFHHLPANQYDVQLLGLYRWQQSVPASAYSITLADAEVKDSVLFGSYELPVGTLTGLVYNDLNRNGVRDTLEPGLQGWTVSALGPDSWSVNGTTDSTGGYVLQDVVVGPHEVMVQLAPYWRRSMLPYEITLGALETIDSLDFGVYALQPGSISGTLYNDLDNSGSRDPGEPALSGLQIQLSGNAYATVATDDSGHYGFSGLWPGSYNVRFIPDGHWRQTYPASLQPHHVGLADEQNSVGNDFGAFYDSSFNIAFRTFFPESIAYTKDSKGKLGKSEKAKPYGSEYTFDLVTPIGGLTGLHVEFSQAIFPATLTVTHFPPPLIDSRFRKADFHLTGNDELANSEHVIIFVRGNKGKPLTITKYWWMKESDGPAAGTVALRTTLGTGRLLLQMPNVMNMMETMYSYGWGPLQGLIVGILGPHSIYHPKPNDVWKSLYDKPKDRMHIGPPRCLGVFATNLRSITKATKTLTPTKGNNKLFAEALALKVNLKASELWVTPPGLGELVFDAGNANPFSGLPIHAIAESLDHAMSAFDEGTKTCIRDDEFFNQLYTTVRMIDSAFSGPFDTVSFGGGLVIKPARFVSDVPYLHLDSSFTQAGTRPVRTSRLLLPEEFSLYQNYPNPFNPTTTISFNLARPSIVTLKIFNTLGQEIATVLDRQEMEDGSNDVEFDASNLPSGIYFYHLKAEGLPDEDGVTGQTVTAVKKMVLMK